MEQLTVRIQARRIEASGVVSLALTDPYGRALPAFTAGAHIDVQIAPGLTRQYSLFNAPSETHRYCIAVLRESTGRGGSQRMYDALCEGDLVTIGVPRNAFSLTEDGTHAVLVAGGIGITPILAMAHRLHAIGQSFELHYFARSRERAAFVDALAAMPFAPQTACHFDDEAGTAPFDLASVLSARLGDHARLYVCGPGGFMQHVEAITTACGWPIARLHRESFSPPARDANAVGTDRAFRVRLARREQVIEVGATQSLLAALQLHGVDVPVSCEQGVCGTCLVDVIAGEPEHRDTFMTATEHRANRQIAVCCSRARSPELTLDL